MYPGAADPISHEFEQQGLPDLCCFRELRKAPGKLPGKAQALQPQTLESSTSNCSTLESSSLEICEIRLNVVFSVVI